MDQLNLNAQEQFEEAIETAYKQSVEEWKTAVLVYADWLDEQGHELGEKLRLLMQRAEILHDRTNGELSTLEDFEVETGYVYRITPGENGQTVVNEVDYEDEQGYQWSEVDGVGFHGSDIAPTDGYWLTDEQDGGYLILHQSDTVDGIENRFSWEIEPVELESDWYWYDGACEEVLLRRDGRLHWIGVSV